MSPDKPPSKRLKQSTLSDFFGASQKPRVDSTKTKEVDEKEEPVPEMNTNSADFPSASETAPKTMSALADYSRESSSSPSNSINLSNFKVNSDEDPDSASECEKKDESENECHANGNSPENRTSVLRPGADAAQNKSRDPKNFYSKTDGKSLLEAVPSPQVDSDDSSSSSKASHESRCEIRVFPLDLDQEAGVMPEDLTRFPRDVVWRPGDLEDSPGHTVLIQAPYVVTGGASKPSPPDCIDVWDQYHVKMPISSRSLYTDPQGQNVSRWELIERSLLTPMHSFHDFREAVLSYNGGFSWDMEEFEDLLEEMDRDERMSFFENLLPAIVNLALRMPSTCTEPPPLLTKGRSHSVTMSQVQASCILANAFLSTFPRRNTTKPESQFYNYPSINFHTLFNRCYREKRRSCRKEKIRCILNYFRRVTEKEPEGNITFTRVKLRCGLGWETSQARFQKAFVTSEGLIEDQGYGMLMVDFANRKVGGGVLRDGCVQEETLFVLYPELICARLFTEALEEDEALLITGVERFNEYKGFGDEFKWTGNVSDFAERDSWGRKYTQIVAIDALAHRGKRQQRQQFAVDKVLRELVKAFCGFQTPGFPRSCLATGNWGCGAFGGDARLKFLIQWMAASRAGRQLTYFTFGNHQLMCELRALQGLITEQNISIGDLFLLLKRYDRLYISNEANAHPSLSDYLLQNFSTEDSE